MGIGKALAAFVKLILFILKGRSTPEKIKERSDNAIDRETAKKDYDAKSDRLSKLMDDTE